MRVRPPLLIALAAVLTAAACAVWQAQPLPVTASRAMPATGRFRAGMARVDITPPPGLGLGGSGMEGRRSTGYRTRLYVGALVLEDPGGERIALVVADLPHVPANLHRLAAARLVDGTGIGADRLLISATHTHSGPANFYGERQYNNNSSRVVGYDPRATDVLVSRIAAAVEQATASLRPSAIAWGETTVAGATTNRSPAAFCRNPESASLCRGGLDPRMAVDRTLVMLRVDVLDSLGRRRPLGSYSVFALRGTTIPNLNTVYDGDVHLRIVERLARTADPAGRPTMHLLANGAEGDVAPDIERDGCDPPRLGLAEPVSAPRGPGESVDFLEPPARGVDRCLADALDDVEAIADSVARAAAALYRALEARLASTAEVRRVFTTEWLPGRDSLCGAPVVGSATAGGAELLETRVRGWRWLLFPVLKLGLEEGGTAVYHDPRQCQSPKSTLLDPFQSLIVGEHGVPETAQLAVVRIDDLFLAAVPGEPTTMVGRRLRRGIEEAVRARGGQEVRAVVLSLTNGFVQYVTTAEEYQAQSYEAGSNLYGPGTAGFLQRRLVELALRLPARGGGPSPEVEIGPIIAYPGPVKAILPVPLPGSVPAAADRIALRCADGLLVGDWMDLPPGALLARSQVWVALEREEGNRWARVAEDGDGRLELHALGDRKGRGFAWRAIWRAHSVAGRFRLVRLDGPGERGRTSDAVACGAR
jgi:neutral ceramidase